MTALGNVIALIRQLDDPATAPLGRPAFASMAFRDFPAPDGSASSLGAVMAFRRAVGRGDGTSGPEAARAGAGAGERSASIESFRRIGSPAAHGAAFRHTGAEVQA